MPLSLRFILRTILDNDKNNDDKETCFRSILYHILINKVLSSAMMKPYRSEILENCKMPKVIPQFLNSIETLKAIIYNQLFTKENLTAANELIQESQYKLYIIQKNLKRLYQ